MRTLFARIMSLLLVVLMITLTMGVSLFRHYCSCSNTLTTSILVEPDCTSHQNNLCEHNNTPSEQTCCSHIAPKPYNDQPHCETSSCCKTEKKILAIETKYQPSSFKLSKIHSFILEILAGMSLIKPVEEEVKLCAKYTERPPPIFGRKLLTAIHQLKIEFPVC